MDNLNKRIFKGIRQASLTTYQNTADKDGFLWLLKDGDKRFICLGEQKYSTTDPEQTEADVKKKIDDSLKSFVEGDLLHSFTEDGKLKNEITLSLKTDEKGKDILHLTGKDNTDIATLDMSKFAIDGMVDTVTYDKTTHTLTVSWNTSAGKTDTVIALTDLVDVCTNGDGIEISDNGTISIKLSDDSQSFLTVNEKGIMLSNVDGLHITLGKEITDADGNVIDKDEKIADSLQFIHNLIKETRNNITIYRGDDSSILITDGKNDNERTISLNTETSTDDTIEEGHIEIVNGDNGVYAKMYYLPIEE